MVKTDEGYLTLMLNWLDGLPTPIELTARRRSE